MTWERPFSALGVMLVLMGIVLILIPIIVKLVPEIDVEKIPWFLLYIYHKDGFFFATSPLLILIGIIYFLWAFLHRQR
jgi:hypothetical protein